MPLADNYAPTRAIVSSIIFGVVLGVLGVAMYLRPQVGWAMARLRMSKNQITDAKRDREATSNRSFRFVGVGLVLVSLVIIGISIKYAVT